MRVASQVVGSGSVHSLLDIMIDHFEEKRKCRIPWSSNTSMTSPRSTESSSSDSSPRRPTLCLLTSEEALLETKIKGNILRRINWLEDHVLKLEEEMKAKKKMIMGGGSPNHNNMYRGMRRKNKPFLVTEQLRKHLRSSRGTPEFSEKAEARDATKAKQRTLLQKILHAGPIEKPLKGWNFLLGSCKGTLLEENKKKQLEKGGEQNVTREEPTHHHGHLKIKRKKEEETMKKAVLPMVKMSKLKSLDEVEVSRVFSLQGIQSYTPWEMKHGR